uniref:UPF0505 protein C16orf62 homolog n=1 Tax=Hirondellea gigas TaxID=1518452 RepID=A0A6A7G0V0_9CRUS
MKDQVGWHVKDRDWSKEMCPSACTKTTTHPLCLSASTQILPLHQSGTSLASTLPCLGEIDPLSMATETKPSKETLTVGPCHNINSKQSTSSSDNNVNDRNREHLQLWTQMISELSNNKSKAGTIGLVSTYLPSPDTVTAGSEVTASQVPAETARSAELGPHVKTALTGKQRIEWRLQQLQLSEGSSGSNNSAAASSCVGFTPDQFCDWVAAVKSRLKQAWQADQRSLALKLVIQSIRLLSVSTPREFYGRKFVLIIDVLDTLAQLVLHRLTSCSDGGETGHNWWRKVCSIRELLPRLYLQTALLPAIALLSGKEYSNAVWCVCSGVRGVGDGVVALLLRSYITRCLTSACHTTPACSSLTATADLEHCKAPKSDRMLNRSKDDTALCHTEYWFCNCTSDAFRGLHWSWKNSSGSDMHDSSSSSSSSVQLLQPVVCFLYSSATAYLSPAQSEAMCEQVLHLTCPVEAAESSNNDPVHINNRQNNTAGIASNSVSSNNTSRNQLDTAPFNIPADRNSNNKQDITANAVGSNSTNTSNRSTSRTLVTLLDGVGLTGTHISTMEYVWLCSVVRSLPPHLITPRAHTIITHTAARSKAGLWSSEWCSIVLSGLATTLSSTGALTADVAPITLLAAALPIMSSMPVQSYLTAANAYLLFAAKHCTVLEVEGVLRQVLRKVTAAESTGVVPSGQLISLLTTVLQHSHHSICTTDSMLGVLGVAQQLCSREAGKLSELVKCLLSCHSPPITNIALAHQLLALAAAVHNSHSCLTTDDERRDLSEWVCVMVQRLRLPDSEHQLSVYVNMRAAFPQLQPVLAALVHAVCRLLMLQSPAAAPMGNRRKTAAVHGSLARACVANAFISIASLTCPAQRLRLYLLTASVARIHSCHAQADSCLKSSIRELSTCLSVGSSSSPCSSSDCWAHSSTSSMVGAVGGLLVAAPDPPSSITPLYLVRGLIQAVTTAGIIQAADSSSLTVCSQLVSVVCSAVQQHPVYRCTGEEVSDSWLLSLPSASKTDEAQRLCQHLLQQLLQGCPNIKGGKEEAAAAASQVLNTMASWLQDAPTIAASPAAAPLWRIMQQHPHQKTLLPWLQSRLRSSNNNSS